MNDELNAAYDNFMHGMSRIADFWGFPKAMGAIYGAVYLSPEPISLDELVERVGVSKGSVSTNVRTLERLGMVHKHLKLGDRKDYYLAETDFWKVAKGVLKEREKSEFDRALRSVGESLEMVKPTKIEPANAELAGFYRERMQAMQSFFNTLDNLVSMLTALDDLRMGSLQALMGRGLKR